MRALLLVLDSVGSGGAPDAAKYSDEGANTLGHILEQLPELALPNLCSLGLKEVFGGTCFRTSFPLAHPSKKRGRADARPSEARTTLRASFGKMQERSVGKDTTTGHWEIAGVILDQPFALYEYFPEELVSTIQRDANVHFMATMLAAARHSRRIGERTFTHC